ncbi:DNA-binding of Mlu1-box binding protein MBP1 [Venustampulla echinocandica]|uniref:DNA-binding of Mlu1-box binding protein MBP1 n=1 Tax=Venustampulla echinocandica TaxID=2656787 RepID=A0A370TAA0_9HELO|nr:DNA-binding of Mlu1-box binding protein MBP1 [Venustampulla echinocandica]RDL30738.1 DNA-binding of Mlu1-box binding protein MBP1 [Venustampulla echinocandica]
MSPSSIKDAATPSRHLPERVNPLMAEEVPPYETLVTRRRLGQTDLAVKTGQAGVKPKNLGTFDYAHLRAPLPKGIMSGIFHPSPASYFLMRRSNDGYISATGMFKATFPYAEVAEEDMERKYVKGLEDTSADETAGNVWIPPQSALKLAEEYQILPWIQALLDNTPIEVNPTRDGSPKPISSPPSFFLLPQEALAPPTPSRGRTRRSASPSKIASPRKTVGSTRARKSKKEDSVEPSAKAASKNFQQALKAAANEDTESKKATEKEKAPEKEKTSEKEKPEETAEELANVEEEPVVRVNVDTEVEVKGDVETTHTHVEVEMPAGSAELPLPEDTEAMIAKAKEMVEAATKNQNASDAAPPKRSKRKAEEVEDTEKEEGAEVPAPAKKVKVDSELKKERVKTRALIGISATLALGAAVQYAFSVL